MREINPEETTTRLVRFSRRKGLKLNMLMCWCVGRAASGIKEFYMLPVGRKLMQYDSIAVNTIVADSRGEVSSCDIPWSEDMAAFNRDYLRLTAEVAEKCRNHDITDSMVIGTSALARYDIDGACSSTVSRKPYCYDQVHSSRRIRQLCRRHTAVSRVAGSSAPWERLSDSHFHSQYRRMCADRPALRPVLQVLRDSFRPVSAAHDRPVRWLHDIFDLFQRGNIQMFLLYVLGSIICGILATLGGYALIRLL